MILKGSTSSDNMQEGQKIEVIDPRPAEVKETLADIRETIKDLDWLPKHSLKDKINAY